MHLLTDVSLNRDDERVLCALSALGAKVLKVMARPWHVTVASTKYGSLTLQASVDGMCDEG